MDPLSIIRKYYRPGTRQYEILLRHSELVTEKALEVADRASELNPDREFIREAAMLHDIGIMFVSAPDIDCRGHLPYMMHAVKGRELLEKEGYPRHARVCENHIDVTAEQVREQRLPLPERDMVPQDINEEIISFADRFYSKNPGEMHKRKTVSEILVQMRKYGKEKRFLEWCRKFKEPISRPEGS